MGRNNKDFRGQALYHGTNHPFEIGDIINPTPWKAFATPDEKYAQGYAEDKAENQRYENPELHVPKVYTVEPVEPEEVSSTNPLHVTSTVGFRVTGVHKRLPERKFIYDD